MAATEYHTGHVKRHPVSGAVAIRTVHPEEHPNSLVPSQAWLMATDNFGAHHKSTADVEAWEDLYVPTPAVVEPPPAPKAG